VRLLAGAWAGARAGGRPIVRPAGRSVGRPVGRRLVIQEEEAARQLRLVELKARLGSRGGEAAAAAAAEAAEAATAATTVASGSGGAATGHPPAHAPLSSPISSPTAAGGAGAAPVGRPATGLAAAKAAAAASGARGLPASLDEYAAAIGVGGGCVRSHVFDKPTDVQAALLLPPAGRRLDDVALLSHFVKGLTCFRSLPDDLLPRLVRSLRYQVLTEGRMH
jgi:hypothetical protein